MLMQKTRIRTYKQMTKREILADSLLLLTALIWGCAFAVVKNALDSFPPGAIIAMRYLIAAAITGILFCSFRLGARCCSIKSCKKAT
mgnify:CR=1 FL=1